MEKKRKQERLETRKHRYYIFTEGEKTEPQYFQAFKCLIENNPIYKNMVLIETIPCQADTLHVVEDAEKYVADNKIDKCQIWYVFDKDDFSADRFNSAIKRTETNSQNNPDLQCHAAWSNRCIEFWFLLHFCFYTSNNHRSD